MDPILILIITGVLVALLVIVLTIKSVKLKSLNRKHAALIKAFAAESGYTMSPVDSGSIEWSIETPDWLIYFDSDRGAESPSPHLHLSAKTPLTSAPEFIAVCNHARKSLTNGMMRSMTTALTQNLVFSTFQKGSIPFAKIYDLIDREHMAPFGKNEKPYLALYANSIESLRTITSSDIPRISDELNIGEQRVDYNNSPHTAKINPHLEVAAHCSYPTLAKVKALIAMYEAVKKLD